MTGYQVELSDSEWMSLIRKTEDSQLPPCCANISALRDQIILLASQRGDLRWCKPNLLRAYAAARDGHDLDPEQFPVLEKLMQQVDQTPGLTRADLPTLHKPDITSSNSIEEGTTNVLDE